MRRRVGAIEGPVFYPALSARWNLRLLASLGGIVPDRVEEVLRQVGLTERAGEVRALVRRLADSGKTILVSSHLLSEIEHICDQLLVIRDGNRVFSGPIADVERHQHSELVVRPDRPDDQARLFRLLDRHGYLCEVGGDEIRVATADHAAAINRLAIQAGITLAQLRSEREGLEATFLRMMEERAA